MKSRILFSTLALVALAGCGGGGGSSTASTSTSSISGVAAVGYPLVGATVTARCTSGSDVTSSPTGANGSWTINVPASAFPCALRAENGTINGVANTTPLHSYAASAGTANVTSLTDLILALASGKVSETWFASFLTSSQPNLTSARTSLFAALSAAQYTLPGGSFDPFTATFSAQTGDSYDDFLEELKTGLGLAGQTHSQLLTSLAAVAGGSISVPKPPVVRTTTFGDIQGAVDTTNGAYSWLGIPYAAAPVGALRWMSPTDPASWSTKKQTTQFGNACAQVGGLLGPMPAGQAFGLNIKDNFGLAVGSEDCLTLNVWRPTTAETNLPVMVFVYGGSNRVGWTGSPEYNGARLAGEQKVIVVTVNYRTGIFGWLNHASLKTGDANTDSGNFGTLDLVQSLKFVKNNIAAFGGDSSNVTVAGQSAGARNVWSLIVSPNAAGLFHKAIPLSNAQGANSTAASANFSLILLQQMLIQDNLAVDIAAANTYLAGQTNTQIKDYLRGKSTAYLTAMLSNSTVLANFGSTQVIYDGVVQPASAGVAFTGAVNNVPVLSGVTNEEGKFPGFGTLPLQPGVFFTNEWIYMANFQPDNPSAAPVALTDILLPAYLPANKTHVDCSNTGWNGYSLYCGGSTTNFWNAQAATLNTYQALQVQTYAYNFAWAQQPAPWNTITGAAHVLDVPFMFGNFGTGVFSSGFSTANKSGREALSLMMRKSVAEFMRTGNPNHAALGATWLPWSLTNGEAKRLDWNASDTTASAVMSTSNNPTTVP